MAIIFFKDNIKFVPKGPIDNGLVTNHYLYQCQICKHLISGILYDFGIQHKSA